MARAAPQDLTHDADGPRLVGCPAMPACVRCGTITTESGRYCPACGAASGSEPAVPADPAAATDRLEVESSATGSLVGRTVGDFAIEGVIGGGSFGTVYRGRQLGLDRPVAIKVPTHEIAADPIQARRFAREARAAARIVHPGVVAIYAVGELDDGRPYLAMQLIEGEPLDRVLRDGPVPPARALRIARHIASALSETHAADVVHRDLKPTNVMWRRDRNGDDRITLVDFGIAVCKPGNADATRLTTGGLIGTPHYMSPEQAQGEQVDARADLYGLGCLLFELVTETTPFDGSGFEVLLAHLGRPPPKASTRNPAVPGSVDRLIAHLMQKKRDDRPTSADAVVAMIDEVLDELGDRSHEGRRAGSSASGRPARSRPRRPTPDPEPVDSAVDLLRRSRSRRWLAVAAVVAIALSGAGFAAYRLRGGVATAGDNGGEEPEPAESAGQLRSPSGEPLQLITRDDGELLVRTAVPEVIHANVSIHAHIEIKTKLGSRFRAKQVVVTIEDPDHRATAQTAAVHGGEMGHYAFRHTFTRTGPHVVRIFPSETETVSTIDLDVVP
jgi:serine/threonine protein kinase